MKKIISIIGLLFIFPFFSSADTIFFKNGMRLDVDSVWEEDGLVKYELYGGIVGKPKEEVLRIERDQPTETQSQDIAPAENLEKNKPLQGEIGNVSYRSDSQLGAEFVRILAQEAHDLKGNVIKWFFLYNDSTLLVFLTPTGDKLFSLTPNVFKGLIRRYTKNMRDVFGSSVSVVLKESDETTIGKGSISLWDGHIKVKLY